MQPHVPPLQAVPDLGSLQSDTLQKTAQLLQTLQQSLLRPPSPPQRAPLGGAPLRRENELVQSLLLRHGGENWTAQQQQQLQQLLQATTETAVAGSLPARSDFDLPKLTPPPLPAAATTTPPPTAGAAAAQTLPRVGSSLGVGAPAGWEERMAVLKRLQEQRADLMERMLRLQQRGDPLNQYAALKHQLLKVASVESKISAQMSGVASIAASRPPPCASSVVKSAIGGAGVYVPPTHSIPEALNGPVQRIVQRLERRRNDFDANSLSAAAAASLLKGESLAGTPVLGASFETLQRRIQEQQQRLLLKDPLPRKPSQANSAELLLHAPSAQLLAAAAAAARVEERSPASSAQLQLGVPPVAESTCSSAADPGEGSSPRHGKRGRPGGGFASRRGRRAPAPGLSGVAVESAHSDTGAEQSAGGESSESGEEEEGGRRLPAKQRRLLMQQRREEALQRRCSEAAAALRRERAQRQRRRLEERENQEAGGEVSDSASDSDASRQELIERKLYRRLKQLAGDAMLEFPNSRSRGALFRDAHSLQQKLDAFVANNIACETLPNPCALVNAYTTTARFRSANHRAMLGDCARVALFVQAINQKARGAKAVLEVGAGPFCLLSINAARAGARRVVALEVSRQSAYEAASFVRMYGFSEQIRVVNAFSKEADLERLALEMREDEGALLSPERNASSAGAGARSGRRKSASSNNTENNTAESPPSKQPARDPSESAKAKGFDLIIHEIIGDICSNEGVADVVLDVQTRTGVVPKSIPFAARTWFCPCELPSERQIRFPHEKYPLRTLLSPNRVLLQSVGLRYHPLLLAENFAPLEDLRFEEPMAGQMLQRRTASFRCQRSGKMAGLLLCNEVELLEGLSLDNRRPEEQTHWYTNVALLREEVSVSEGDLVVVHSCADLKNYQVVDVPEGRGLADCEDVKRNLHPERATALRPLRKQPRTAFSLQQTPTLSIPEGAAPAAASPASSTFPSGTTKSGSGIAVQEEKSGAFETAPFTPFECPPQTAETPLQKNWKRVRLSRPRFCFEVQIHRGGRLCDLCAERLGASNSRTTSAASEWPAAASCGEGGGEGRGETKASEDSSASSSAGVGCVAAAGNEDESSALSASGPVVKAEQKEASASPGSPPKRARDASRPFPSEGASAAGGVVGEGRRRGGAAGGWRRGRSGVVSSGKGAGGQFGEDEDEGAECTCEGGTEDASGRPRFERLPLVVINYAEQSPHIDRAVARQSQGRLR